MDSVLNSVKGVEEKKHLKSEIGQAACDEEEQSCCSLLPSAAFVSDRPAVSAGSCRSSRRPAGPLVPTSVSDTWAAAAGSGPPSPGPPAVSSSGEAAPPVPAPPCRSPPPPAAAPPLLRPLSPQKVQPEAAVEEQKHLV